MPPKVKTTKEDILRISLALLREQGESAINARSIATALGCSTQPIFSNFSTMEELQDAVRDAAYEHYLSFIQQELTTGKHPPYKAYGMAYVRFAKEEKQLFRVLFMRDRTDADLSPSSDFEESVTLIMNANGVSRQTATKMHLEMWACVHGIGTMLATSFLPLAWETVSEILSDVYFGIRSRHVTEEDAT